MASAAAAHGRTRERSAAWRYNPWLIVAIIWLSDAIGRNRYFLISVAVRMHALVILMSPRRPRGGTRPCGLDRGFGVAMADLYPRFTLSGIAQRISTSLSTLFAAARR